MIQGAGKFLPSVLETGGVEWATVVDNGEFVNTRKYQQARRQKEESRKARQQQKLERRLGKVTTPEGTPVADRAHASHGTLLCSGSRAFDHRSRQPCGLHLNYSVTALL